MPLTRRYGPPHPPGETAAFGMDFSTVIPWGVVIESQSLSLFTNTQPPVAADGDWSKGAAYTRGRSVFVVLSGGVVGKDYIAEWTVTDSRSNIWVRSGLILCSPTS